MNTFIVIFLLQSVLHSAKVAPPDPYVTQEIVDGRTYNVYDRGVIIKYDGINMFAIRNTLDSYVYGCKQLLSIFLACTIHHEVDFSTAYRAVRNSPGVLGVVPNYLTFTATISDQIHSNQWHFKNTGGAPAYGTAGADVNVRKAWDISNGSGDVNVVVMDTGIPLSYPYVLSHPDLGDSNRIIIYTDTIPDYALPRDYGNQPPTLSDATFSNGTGRGMDISGGYGNLSHSTFTTSGSEGYRIESSGMVDALEVSMSSERPVVRTDYANFEQLNGANYGSSSGHDAYATTYSYI